MDRWLSTAAMVAMLTFGVVALSAASAGRADAATSHAEPRRGARAAGVINAIRNASHRADGRSQLRRDDTDDTNRVADRSSARDPRAGQVQRHRAKRRDSAPTGAEQVTRRHPPKPLVMLTASQAHSPATGVGMDGSLRRVTLTSNAVGAVSRHAAVASASPAAVASSSLNASPAAVASPAMSAPPAVTASAPLSVAPPSGLPGPEALPADVGAQSAAHDSADSAIAGATGAVSIVPWGSIGEAIGLHRTADPLALRSSVALVTDAASGEVLFEKNSGVVLPIASITKLLAAVVLLDARQPLDELLRIEQADRDTERFSRSHLPVGSVLSRGELLQLALMSSENRAASALARNYPGGLERFVEAANRKARAIGMADTRIVDGTGLSSSNVATARDLSRLAQYAATYEPIRRYSTASGLLVRTGTGARSFHTTNRLVGDPAWQLDVQKTGYITEAGNCLLIKGRIDGRAVIIVLLDSEGRLSRIGDAQRVRRYLQG